MWTHRHENLKCLNQVWANKSCGYILLYTLSHLLWLSFHQILLAIFRRTIPVYMCGHIALNTQNLSLSPSIVTQLTTDRQSIVQKRTIFAICCNCYSVWIMSILVYLTMSEVNRRCIVMQLCPMDLAICRRLQDMSQVYLLPVTYFLKGVFNMNNLMGVFMFCENVLVYGSK